MASDTGVIKMNDRATIGSETVTVQCEDDKGFTQTNVIVVQVIDLDLPWKPVFSSDLSDEIFLLNSNSS